MSHDLLALAFAVFFAAGIVKGAVGIGLPTIVISVLSTFIDPRLAMASALLPVLLTNTLQFSRAGADKRLVLRYLPFIVLLIGANYWVSRLSFAADTAVILLALGCTVVVFAICSLLRQPPALNPRWDAPAQYTAGLLAGIMGGLTTIWSPPMVIYLLSKRLQKEEFVLITGAILSAGSLPLLLSYWQSGVLVGDVLLQSALLAVPTVLGMRLGELIRARINTEWFVKMLLLVFLLLGLNLIRRAVF